MATEKHFAASSNVHNPQTGSEPTPAPNSSEDCSGSYAETPSAQNDDEDEWEYEYHETDVEDYYVTLDMADVLTDTRPRNLQLNPINSKDVSSKGNDDAQTGRLQIMELHSDNPIIAYDGKLYSCQWASALGTDLHFASIIDTYEMNVDPLRPGDKVDLIGAGAARLVAKSVEVKPRLAPDTLEGESADVLSGRSNFDTVGGKESQMRFLDRLNRVKRKRGEVDRLPIGLFRPKKEFAERYRNQYTPPDDEVDNTEEKDMPTLTSADLGKVRRKKKRKYKLKLGEQSLHGDNSTLRAEFEEEMRKHTPMTRESFIQTPRPVPTHYSRQFGTENYSMDATGPPRAKPGRKSGYRVGIQYDDDDDDDDDDDSDEYDDEDDESTEEDFSDLEDESEEEDADVDMS